MINLHVENFHVKVLENKDININVLRALRTMTFDGEEEIKVRFDSMAQTRRKKQMTIDVFFRLGPGQATTPNHPHVGCSYCGAGNVTVGITVSGVNLDIALGEAFCDDHADEEEEWNDNDYQN